MAIDVKTLTQIISDFRKLQSKDAISPESLGAILQRIADLLATAGTSDTVTAIQTILNGFKAAGQAVCSIEQGAADRNNILANIKAVDLGNGSIATASNNLFIKQATTERAGAMRAQQVVDLNNARNRIAEILPLLEKIQAKLGMTDGTKGLYNTAQISVAVVGSTLKIYGAQQLIADGYVPYLFRHTRKCNQWGDKLVIEAGGATKKYCDKRKGWNLYGSVHSVKISGSTLSFSINPKTEQTTVAIGLARCPRHRPYTPRRHPLNRLGPLDNLPSRPQEPEEAPHDPTALCRRLRKEDAPRSLPYHHRQPRKLARRVLDNLQPQHQTMDFRKVIPTGNCGLIIDTSIPNPHFPIPGGKSLHKKDSPHGRAARVMLSVLYRFPIARGRNLRRCYRKCCHLDFEFSR